MYEVSMCNSNAAGGFLQVMCPDLSAEINTKLGRPAKGNRKVARRGPAENTSRILLEVALIRPLTMNSVWLGGSCREYTRRWSITGKHLYLRGSFKGLYRVYKY
jgi:hypothetical protein